MAKLTLADLTSSYSSITAINDNNTLIETAVENTLSRDGTAPNSMAANIDMNSNRLLNLPEGASGSEPVTVAQLQAAQTDSMLVTAASNVTIVDAGAHYAATHVEGALAEVFDDLGAVTTGNGASRIGIEDAGTLITATDVEGALAEIAALTASATLTTEGVVELATGAEIDAETVGALGITSVELGISLNYGYETGTFVVDWLGFTTVPQTTYTYTKQGKLVMLRPSGSVSATSNSTGFSSTGTPIPVSIRPTVAATNRTAIAITDNGATALGSINIVNTGAINFGADIANAAFTATGTKGFIGGWNIAYLLD